jgi:serine/threonine protein kinase
MNVIHTDLTCDNICLDDSLHAKLLDFGGASLDGSEPLVAVTASHRCPGNDFKSTRADLFALGSTLYEIFTGKPPYHDLGLKEIEITELFKQSKFPNTKSLGPMGKIITGCWQGEFTGANDVLKGTPPVNFPSLLGTDAVQPSTSVSKHVLRLLLSSR